MNQETFQILETIQKNVFLRAKILNEESREISIGVANVSEDGRGIYSPDLKTQQDSLTQRAKFVQFDCKPSLSIVAMNWCGSTLCDYHFQV
jgi:hypothetical protein